MKKICSAVEPMIDFFQQFCEDNTVFATQDERKVALGWFLRDHGPRFVSISLLASAIHGMIDVDQIVALNTEIERLGL